MRGELERSHGGRALVGNDEQGHRATPLSGAQLAEALRGKGAGLRVLNLGGGDVDTATPMGSMVFTVMAALAQMELEIKRERITDSVAKRRAAGKDLGGRRQTFTDSQIRNALRLIESGEPATQVARDLGMSRATLYRRIRELPQATTI